ncbi:MAG: ABC transporter permease [Candidatus Nanohaloarchaeota archaeon QJJ-7]|nr:ABC transporter permease [Candidatus Nanohaloarchaeota archaeon QJJ-7]
MRADLAVLAVRNILNRKRRSWLTVIGIFIGIAAVVALISLGQGLDQAITGEFESIGADKVFVTPGGDPTGSTSFSQSSTVIRDSDLRAVRRARGVDEAEGALMRSTRLTYQDSTAFASVVGIPSGSQLLEESFSFTIDEGRMIRGTDRSGVVIGSRVADGVFEEDVELRRKVGFQNNEFRVVGVLEATGDPGVDAAVIMPYDRAQEIFDTGDVYDYVVARQQAGFEAEQVKENIERSLRNERGLDEGDEDFTVSTPADILSSFQSVLGIVQAIVVGIASISLLVGGVGIMNTMYTAVKERTREIGVMKAVGAEDRQIMILFLLESGLIGLVGGIVGVTVGLGISKGFVFAARQYSALPLEAAVSWGLIVGALLFAFLVGALSGVLPARTAAKLEPADALRYE